MYSIRAIHLAILLCALLVVTSCASPPIEQSAQLPPITVKGTQLLAGNKSFEVRGVNYIHPSNADLTKCADLQFGADGNCPWDLAPIAADMDQLKALNVNTVRVFLNYYAFGGARAADPNYDISQPLANL